MDKVIHFEIPVDNLDRAKKFYSIFGWNLQDLPGMDYTVAHTVAIDESRIPTEKGAINGGMTRRTPELKVPTIAINVESIDQTIQKVLTAGGKVVMPKKEIGGMGYYAYVSDTEGNTIGLWEHIGMS